MAVVAVWAVHTWPIHRCPEPKPSLESQEIVQRSEPQHERNSDEAGEIENGQRNALRRDAFPVIKQ